MSENLDNLWELLEIFRSSPCYKDVVWQIFGVMRAPTEMNELLAESLDEFRAKLPAFFHKYTMIRSRTYESILSNISQVKEFREALLKISNGDLNAEQGFMTLRGIPGAGVFVSSTILNIAFEGKFIVFSDGVWDGFQELFPSMSERIEKPYNYKSYYEFQQMCNAIADVYGIDSMAELHEFLWHGNDSEWNFYVEE
ncbi:MAG: hypothetical protein ACFFER_07500 [Candidatus Thorarchaeota archaeon]